jgi:HK97 family phage portal protein
MGLWPLRATADAGRAALTASSLFPENARIYQLTTGAAVSVDVTDLPVPRAAAMSLPAVARAVTLIATTVAGLPLHRYDAAGNRVDVGWLEQPEEGRPRWNTFSAIGQDLLLDGVSYLRIDRRDANNSPKLGGLTYLPLERVGQIILQDGRTTITFDGITIPPEDVLGFEGWHNGIRRHGSRVIRTALALQAAARRMADTPMPAQVLKNTSGYELSDAEVDDLILAYKTARNTEAVAYLNAGVDLSPIGWDSKELQLVEAQQFVAAQLANLVGVPPHVIAGANTSGSSVSYTNVTQENRSLIDYGLTPLIKCLEARLSMTDSAGMAWANQVTPRGTRIVLSLDGLLRGNPLERAQLYQILIPLGVLTVNEARAWESLTPEGIPNQ